LDGMGLVCAFAAERNEGRGGYTDVCMHSTAQGEDIYFYLERNVGIGYVFPCIVRIRSAKLIRNSHMSAFHQQDAEHPAGVVVAYCIGFFEWPMNGFISSFSFILSISMYFRLASAPTIHRHACPIQLHIHISIIDSRSVQIKPKTKNCCQLAAHAVNTKNSLF
jgi:hypothetical protein